jgi:hypothetical protein
MHWLLLQDLATTRTKEWRSQAESARRARQADEKTRRRFGFGLRSHDAIWHRSAQRLDCAPDTYAEFLTRSEGWLKAEPSADERSDGRAA